VLRVRDAPVVDHRAVREDAWADEVERVRPVVGRLEPSAAGHVLRLPERRGASQLGAMDGRGVHALRHALEVGRRRLEVGEEGERRRPPRARWCRSRSASGTRCHRPWAPRPRSCRTHVAHPPGAGAGAAGQEDGCATCVGKTSSRCRSSARRAGARSRVPRAAQAAPAIGPSRVRKAPGRRPSSGQEGRLRGSL
jgi:hypothetical protein